MFFSVFHQLQQVFGQLLESKLQYYEPEKFWKVFKLWGQVVNIREQQDAFDFFTALIDQGDEHTKVILQNSDYRIHRLFNLSYFRKYHKILISILFHVKLYFLSS